MKLMIKRTGFALVGVMLLSGAMLSQASAVDNNLSFSGTLVTEPCDLDPQTTDITVDFGTIVQKSFYQTPRTPGKPFVINLTDCEPSISNSVTFTFKGTESTALPGLLAVTGTATGIAIGLENQGGSAVVLNEATSSMALASGNNQFTFQAYVEAEPDAITNKTITAGDFSAVATFEISYF